MGAPLKRREREAEACAARPPEQQQQQEQQEEEDAIGRVCRERYAGTVRLWLREALLPHVRAGTKHVAAVQRACRTPRLDAFFRALSVVGGHTFYVSILPVFFFFGLARLGLHLVCILAAGIYFGNCWKDFLALPRPPVSRVARVGRGSNAREFGLPSTHTVASYMPVYAYLYTYHLAEGAAGAAAVPAALAAALALLIVFSRVYLGMHSPADLAAGALLGAVLTAAWVVVAAPFVHAGVAGGGVAFPAAVVALALAGVALHPVAPHPCPCYVDSVCFLGAAAGTVLGVHALHASPVPTGPGAEALWPVPSPLSFAVRLAVGLTIVLASRAALKAASRPVFARLVTHRSPHPCCGGGSGGKARWWHAVDADALVRLVTYAGVGGGASALAPAVFYLTGI